MLSAKMTGFVERLTAGLAADSRLTRCSTTTDQRLTSMAMIAERVDVEAPYKEFERAAIAVLSGGER